MKFKKRRKALISADDNSCSSDQHLAQQEPFARFFKSAVTVFCIAAILLARPARGYGSLQASLPFTMVVDTLYAGEIGTPIALRVAITPHVPCNEVTLEVIEADHLKYSGPMTMKRPAVQGQPTEFSLKVTTPHNDTSGFVFDIRGGGRGQTAKTYWVTVGDSVVTYPGNPRLYPVPVEGRDPIVGIPAISEENKQITIHYLDTANKIIVIETGDSPLARTGESDSTLASAEESDTAATKHLDHIRIFKPDTLDTVSYSGIDGKQALLADINGASVLEGDAIESALVTIDYRVQRDTAGVAAVILPRLSQPDVTENALTLYVSVLGVTKAPEAVDGICRIVTETKSEAVATKCARALGQIGGGHAGECMVSALDRISDPYERFIVFNDLGRLQYPGALPMALEVLQSDAERLYWRPIFVFGMMGDLAVPYLVDKVSDRNLNVRFNAINVLGQWLIAPEAAERLQLQFWKENVPMIRNLILSSVEMTAEVGSIVPFMKKVAAEAKDKESVKFAKEAVEIYKTLPDQLATIGTLKCDSVEGLRAAYQSLWDSYGRDGNYELLKRSSTFADEPALKKLRERILQRSSDEAFYDYKAVNQIIYVNRLLRRKE